MIREKHKCFVIYKYNQDNHPKVGGMAQQTCRRNPVSLTYSSDSPDSVHQSHQGGLEKCRFLGSSTRDSNIAGPSWCPGICTLAHSPGDLMQVDKGPCFEKHNANRTQGISFHISWQNQVGKRRLQGEVTSQLLKQMCTYDLT